jgi:uncharacterized protein YggE
MGRNAPHPTTDPSTTTTDAPGRLDDNGRLNHTALGAGAPNLASLQYDLLDRAELERLALAEAVADARRQAEVMAQAAGGRLGELLDLGTQSGQYRPVFEQDASFRMAASAAPTPISPGSVTVTATVTARWRFIPGR